MTKLRYQITTMCSLANFDFSLEEMKTYKDQFSTMKINAAVTDINIIHINIQSSGYALVFGKIMHFMMIAPHCQS
jgi:hypothetical protein